MSQEEVLKDGQLFFDFDVFMKEKKKQFNPDTKVDELLLESERRKDRKILIELGTNSSHKSY